MKYIIVNFLLLACLTLTFCSKPAAEQEQAVQEVEVAPVSSDQVLMLSRYDDSPKFPDAILELNNPVDGSNVAAGAVNFDFNVKNYELAAQTLDADVKGCANSGKGQHIHMILNNQPYSAHYDAKASKELADGHYIMLSFLSRSYHESVKEYGAYLVRQFTVGTAAHEEVDLTGPNMFYSRPKGTYKGKDTEKVILDWYLINTDLSETGNKVRATINGKVFTFAEWTPQYMKGLPMGENTVKLELIDADGNVIPGPYNAVERTFTLAPADA